MPSIKVIPQNPLLTGLSRFHQDVVFARPDGLELKCHILTPWATREDDRRYPAIVFLQGSAWTFPDRSYELPQLCQYANQGYVVMTITHRSREDGHPYPAFLQDAKTAIRFLRAHAEEYQVDPTRIGFWGTSSGGNTSMLVQLTGDDPAFKTEEYANESDAVKCCVQCFGPSDMEMIMDRILALRGTDRPDDDDDLIDTLAGEADKRLVARAMSPYHLIREGAAYPPVLLLHGSADPIVDYQIQGVRMYEKYLACGVDAQMICIEGAPHEGSFWSQEVHDQILRFWQANL